MFGSLLVRTDLVPSRCPFGEGLVVASSPFSAIGVTPVNGAPRAQLTSVNNGGPPGIYWKVNRDPNSRADSLDLIGSWICEDLQSDVTYPPNISPGEIVYDMQQNSLQYPVAQYEAAYFSNGTFARLVSWGSSICNDTGGSFGVLASIDLTAYATDPKIMKTYRCTLAADDLEWVLSTINSSPSFGRR